MRAFRAVRTSKSEATKKQEKPSPNSTTDASAAPDLGGALFGAKTSSSTHKNPFSTIQTASALANPFSSAKSGAEKPTTKAGDTSVTNLSQTFADKAVIAATSQPAAAPQSSSTESSLPWSEDPNPYPSYHLDADKEYLYPEAQDQQVPSNSRVDNEGESSSAADDKAAFESAMDKTFQRFADRLAQNPEQVLRYEFGGEPLLYSKTDAVGKKLGSAQEGKVQTVASKNGSGSGLKIPRCGSCGAGRVFEMQLTPHAITELEADEMSIDGMEWGTVIVGACSEDCQEKGKEVGEVGYLEEWVGVQWEEIAEHGKR